MFKDDEYEFYLKNKLINKCMKDKKNCLQKKNSLRNFLTVKNKSKMNF